MGKVLREEWLSFYASTISYSLPYRLNVICDWWLEKIAEAEKRGAENERVRIFDKILEARNKGFDSLDWNDFFSTFKN